MVQPIVEYKDVHISFGDVNVLKGIDLNIEPSERVAVIGPSGSGKTTLIRMLMTLEKPTAGKIIVDGKPLWHMKKDDELIPANEKHLRQVRGDKIGRASCRERVSKEVRAMQGE